VDESDRVASCLLPLDQVSLPISNIANLVKDIAERKRQRARPDASHTNRQDARLGKAFDAGARIEQLAAAHGRTVGALRARLVKLGRLEAAAR